MAGIIYSCSGYFFSFTTSNSISIGTTTTEEGQEFSSTICRQNWAECSNLVGHLGSLFVAWKQEALFSGTWCCCCCCSSRWLRVIAVVLCCCWCYNRYDIILGIMRGVRCGWTHMLGSCNRATISRSVHVGRSKGMNEWRRPGIGRTGDGHHFR